MTDHETDPADIGLNPADGDGIAKRSIGERMADPIPSREEAEGKRIVELAICAGLEIAGYPGGEEEAICEAVTWALEELGGIDDLETLVATARARFAEHDPETRS